MLVVQFVSLVEKDSNRIEESKSIVKISAWQYYFFIFIIVILLIISAVLVYQSLIQREQMKLIHANLLVNKQQSFVQEINNINIQKDINEIKEQLSQLAGQSINQVDITQVNLVINDLDTRIIKLEQVCICIAKRHLESVEYKFNKAISLLNDKKKLLDIKNNDNQLEIADSFQKNKATAILAKSKPHRSASLPTIINNDDQLTSKNKSNNDDQLTSKNKSNFKRRFSTQVIITISNWQFAVNLQNCFDDINNELCVISQQLFPPQDQFISAFVLPDQILEFEKVINLIEKNLDLCFRALMVEKTKLAVLERDIITIDLTYRNNELDSYKIFDILLILTKQMVKVMSKDLLYKLLAKFEIISGPDQDKTEKKDDFVKTFDECTHMSNETKIAILCKLNHTSDEINILWCNGVMMALFFNFSDEEHANLIKLLTADQIVSLRLCVQSCAWYINLMFKYLDNSQLPKGVIAVFLGIFSQNILSNAAANDLIKALDNKCNNQFSEENNTEENQAGPQIESINIAILACWIITNLSESEIKKLNKIIVNWLLIKLTIEDNQNVTEIKQKFLDCLLEEQKDNLPAGATAAEQIKTMI